MMSLHCYRALAKTIYFYILLLNVLTKYVEWGTIVNGGFLSSSSLLLLYFLNPETIKEQEARNC